MNQYLLERHNLENNNNLLENIIINNNKKVFNCANYPHDSKAHYTTLIKAKTKRMILHNTKNAKMSECYEL